MNEPLQVGIKNGVTVEYDTRGFYRIYSPDGSFFPMAKECGDALFDLKDFVLKGPNNE